MSKKDPTPLHLVVESFFRKSIKFKKGVKPLNLLKHLYFTQLRLISIM